MADFLNQLQELPPQKQGRFRLSRWLKDSMLNLGISLLLLCFGRLSLAATRRTARWLAWLITPFIGGSRRVIETNLRIALPELSPDEIRVLRQKNIRHMIELGLDIIQFLQRPQAIADRMELPEMPPVVRKGEGIIFCLPHLGNWEAVINIYPHTGNPCAAVAASFSSEKLNRLLTRERTSSGAELIPIVGAAFKVGKALRAGKHVGMLIDQNVSPKNGGYFINFFGLPAPTSKLPAVLARRNQVEIMTGACIKLPNGHFTLCLQPLPKPVAEYADEIELTRDILHANEQLIRRYPEQYVWLYKRWRYIPSNGSAALQQHYPFYATNKEYDCPAAVLAEAEQRLAAVKVVPDPAAPPESGPR